MENILGLNCSIFESNSYGVVYCMQDHWNWFITLVQILTCPLAGMIVFESNMISMRVTIWAISIRLRGTARRKNQWRWDNAWMQRSDPETFICARVRLVCSSFEKNIFQVSVQSHKWSWTHFSASAHHFLNKRSLQGLKRCSDLPRYRSLCSKAGDLPSKLIQDRLWATASILIALYLWFVLCFLSYFRRNTWDKVDIHL